MLLPLIALCATAGAGDPGPELADKVVEAYGGAQVLGRVTSFRQTGSVAATAREAAGSFERLYASPGDLSIELLYSASAERRLLVGGHGWRTRGGTELEPVSGPLVDSMVLQAGRVGLPWLLISERDRVHGIDSLDVGGIRCDGLELAMSSALTVRAWVDPASGYVRRSEGTMDMGGQSMTFSAVYDDFRPVQGVVFAHSEQTWAGPTQTSAMIIERIELNPGPLSAP